jgi:hypothetical protein
MVAAKARGDKATVAFRLSRRQDDSTTAFEAGVFKYTVIAKSGASTPKFYPFRGTPGERRMASGVCSWNVSLWK